jgi:hypothetical protein
VNQKALGELDQRRTFIHQGWFGCNFPMWLSFCPGLHIETILFFFLGKISAFLNKEIGKFFGFPNINLTNFGIFWGVISKISKK